MPAKKRIEPFKRTPQTLPTTSVSHPSADQHHRLRHTGPSISTRSIINATPSKPPPRAHLEPTKESRSSPESDRKPLTAVSFPGAHTSFTRFLYVLFFLVLVLSGWYIYGIITLLGRLKEEAGWWGIISGDHPRGTMQWETPGPGSDWPGRQGGRAGAEKGGELEGSLNTLADVLGISPNQVASAVKPLIPRASLASIASQWEATDGSEAVGILFEDTTRNDRGKADNARFAEKLGKGAAEENVAEGEMV